jgi:hypothetical protein
MRLSFERVHDEETDKDCPLGWYFARATPPNSGEGCAKACTLTRR